jgi:hypothetical protein
MEASNRLYKIAYRQTAALIYVPALGGRPVAKSGKAS